MPSPAHTTTTWFLITALALAPLGTVTSQPQWWIDRDVLDPQAGVNNFGPANIGQLKHVATMARDEFEAHCPNGAGEDIDDLVGAWHDSQTGQPLPPNPPDQNLAPINLGQLKAVAKPFYDRLIAENLLPAGAYPWTADPTDDANFAPANIGQLKHVFSFDVLALVVAADPNSDFDGDGISNGDEQNGPNPTDPFVWDSDGDGVSDGDEATANTDPNDAVSLPVLQPPYIKYSEVGLEYTDHIVDIDEEGGITWGGYLELWAGASFLDWELFSVPLSAADLNGMLPEFASTPYASNVESLPVDYAYVASESIRTEPVYEHEWFIAGTVACRDWLFVDVARDFDIRQSFLIVTERYDEGAPPEIVETEVVELVIPARSYYSNPIDYAAEIIEPPNGYTKFVVSLVPLDLAIDANRNGIIASGESASQQNPFRFWINNDDDPNTIGLDTESAMTADEGVVPQVWEDWKTPVALPDGEIEGMRDLKILPGCT